MQGPYFFFSYTREDADPFLDTFYEDLVNEVRSADSAVGAEIAFRDTRSVELGEDWSQGIARALQHANVMVALYSRKYFGREWCGKEWSVFVDRVASQNAPVGSAPLVIPVLWTIPDPARVPAVARVGQWTNDKVSPIYAEKGLRYVTMQRTKRDLEYRDIVHAIAEAVMRGVQRRLPPALLLPDYAAARNAFAAPAGPRPSGPRAVRFVIGAATAHEMSGVRSDTTSYGETALDWKPYAPGSSRRVGPILQRVATDEAIELDSSITVLGDDLDALLTDAERNNSLLILTIDPWSTLVDHCSDALAGFDRRLSLNAATLLPWNESDPTTSEYAEALDRSVRRSFARHYVMNLPSLQSRVGSETDFIERVRDAIMRAQNLIIQYREVRSTAGTASSSSPSRMPQISATRDD